MSSIDKFGRRKESHCVIGRRGPQGIGFKLTNGKQYDIQGKQLKNIGTPIDELDGTTMKYVNNVLQQSTNLLTDNFIAHMKNQRTEIINEIQKSMDSIKIEVEHLKRENLKNKEQIDKVQKVVSKHHYVRS